MKRSYDVVIAGGGIMGSSLAFWLSRGGGPSLNILVVEPDPSYATSSTALSVASIRQQFTNEINIKISRFGVEFIKNIEEFLGGEGGLSDLGFQEQGYLFLAGSQAHASTMRDAAALQRREGADTQLLNRDALSARFPWLSTDGITLGSFGPRDEGWFDNMGFLGAFRRAARARGVDYVADRVAGLVRQGERITAVEMASGRQISCGAAVNACGTQAADLMRTFSEGLPVEPRKRTVFLLDAPHANAPGAPLLVDHTGFYLRPEGRHWLAAIIPKTDAAVAYDDFEPDWSSFEDELWPKLFARIPSFDAVKIIRAWAGHYAFNTLDQNAILGRWPGLENLYVMNGFSGHGLQQAPAVGRGIAELILTGRYQTLDLTPLGPERIFQNKPFLEHAIV